MSEFEIHNGQVFVNGQLQESPSVTPAPTVTPKKIVPEEICAQMARVISEAQGEHQTPMEIVNRLLRLQGPAGEKLVFTRFDVFQCFGIWSQRMSQGARES